MTNEHPKRQPRLRIEVGRHYDAKDKEDAILIKIAAKPGFGAFWNSLSPERLPGYELIRNTPLEPLAKMANFWLLPVTAMLAPDGLRVDMQNDPAPAPDEAGKDKAKQSKDENLPVTDLDWKEVRG